MTDVSAGVGRRVVWRLLWLPRGNKHAMNSPEMPTGSTPQQTVCRCDDAIPIVTFEQDFHTND